MPIWELNIAFLKSLIISTKQELHAQHSYLSGKNSKVLFDHKNLLWIQILAANI